MLSAAACSDDSDELLLTPQQAQLLGRGVRFTTSMADPFITRATYRHDGSFNEGDMMTIYRQYSHNAGIDFDASTEAYRVYSLATKYATGTSFALETDWRPKSGAWGSDVPGTKFRQTDADSITWENGKTVRFRAWSRSNLAGAIDNGSKERYYPDFCVSEWVTVSGPTLDIPLTLKHQGCRIGFTQKAGNELKRAEICTEVEDYLWKDNADSAKHDNSAQEHGKSMEQAIRERDSVVAVYNQMCMPAGISVSNSLLSTMKQSLYKKTENFSKIDTLTAADGIIPFDSLSADDIRDSVQRPLFTHIDNRLYMVTIPYNMSTDSHSGETLRLPACTRFRIWLYDVNNGDRAGTPGEEGYYHILSLADIKDQNGRKLFADGLELKPGYSYLFSVGYHYKNFTITPADTFSWTEQDAENGTAEDQAVERPDEPDSLRYGWWKDAIRKAIPKDSYSKYDPQFHIKTVADFIDFIDLVNGTAVNDYVKANPLTLLIDPTRTFNDKNPATNADYRWYRSEYVSGGKLLKSVNPADSVTHQFANEKGYIFYDHYHAANADQAAYSREDYLKDSYSFFDEGVSRHFTVWLDNDLDLNDWELATIGDEDPSVRLTNSASHPFRGVFDGQLHTLRNVNMKGGYLFGHCFDTAIRNLKIETTHNFMLLNAAEARDTRSGYGAYIVGISIKAPSGGNPIATTLTGSSYVVGCIYEGRAGGAMVGTADNLYMYANMMAATGLPHNTGALLGRYASGANQFFAPQTDKKVTWGRFMANYYLMDRYSSSASEVVHAVGTIADDYRPQEYIRGGLAWVLKAKNDNMLSAEVPYERLTTELMRKGYYGLAPWKAMNYALYQYNLVGNLVSEAHNCKAHYVNDNVGYAHTFPRLVPGEPNSDQDETGYRGKYNQLNLLEQNN